VAVDLGRGAVPADQGHALAIGGCTDVGIGRNDLGASWVDRPYRQAAPTNDGRANTHGNRTGGSGVGRSPAASHPENLTHGDVGVAMSIIRPETLPDAGGV